MEAKCKFETTWFNDPSYGSFPYQCVVKEITGAPVEREAEIKSFTGTHEEGKSNSDVTYIWLFELSIKSIPRNLNKVFTNLKILRIIQCDIQGLTREDLHGLENLEYLDVSGYHHQVHSLPDDLFADMKKLRQVTIFAASLERMSSKILLPIKSTLEQASFRNQQKGYQSWFDKRKSGLNDLEKFMKYIDARFSPESQTERVKALKSASCETAEEINEGDDNEWVDVEDSDATDSENEATAVKSMPEWLPKPSTAFVEFARPSVESAMFEVNKQSSKELAKKEAVLPNLQAESQAEKVFVDFSKFKFN